MYDWDPAKRQANLAKHGLDFTDAARFDWDSAITVRDLRHDYDEERLLSTGYLDDRLHVLIWTPRHPGVRIISLRRANGRERRRWEKEQT